MSLLSHVRDQHGQQAQYEQPMKTYILHTCRYLGTGVWYISVYWCTQPNHLSYWSPRQHCKIHIQLWYVYLSTIHICTDLQASSEGCMYPSLLFSFFSYVQVKQLSSLLVSHNVANTVYGYVMMFFNRCYKKWWWPHWRWNCCFGSGPYLLYNTDHSPPTSTVDLVLL